jgi:hypothetical protein
MTLSQPQTNIKNLYHHHLYHTEIGSEDRVILNVILVMAISYDYICLGIIFYHLIN